MFCTPLLSFQPNLINRHDHSLTMQSANDGFTNGRTGGHRAYTIYLHQKFCYVLSSVGLHLFCVQGIFILQGCLFFISFPVHHHLMQMVCVRTKQYLYSHISTNRNFAMVHMIPFSNHINMIIAFG